MESPERFRDRKIEEELARLWRRASVEFRGMEKSVARLAYSKSEFCIDRDYWTRNGITLSGIAIEDAKKVISEMKF